MKRIPNIISALRILGAASLLFFNPSAAAFWVIYGLCGISDMLDGYLARKLHAESKTGALLDSVADICFVADCPQALLLPSHKSKQADWSSALPYRAYGLLVHRSHHGSCWPCHIRRRPGRAPNQDEGGEVTDKLVYLYSINRN